MVKYVNKKKKELSRIGFKMTTATLHIMLER